MGNCGPSMALKRIKEDLREMQDNPNEMEKAEPWTDEDLFKWVGTIYGPNGSPYQEGVFYVSIVLPHNYPHRPPKVHFTTKVFHPNIDEKGQIKLDILADHWSPVLTIAKMLTSLSSLLSDPNPEDALVPEIAELFKVDKCKFIQTAKEWTLEYAN